MERKDREPLKARILRFINAHKAAYDEALALIVCLGKAILDRRISTLERAEIVRKAEALIRALNSAPEED